MKGTESTGLPQRWVGDGWYIIISMPDRTWECCLIWKTNLIKSCRWWEQSGLCLPFSQFSGHRESKFWIFNQYPVTEKVSFEFLRFCGQWHQYVFMAKSNWPVFAKQHLAYHLVKLWYQILSSVQYSCTHCQWLIYMEPNIIYIWVKGYEKRDWGQFGIQSKVMNRIHSALGWAIYNSNRIH